MKIRFHKYHGAGNDFIIIDNRNLSRVPGVKEVAWLCDRHFGIGADGLMLLSGCDAFDFRMTYFNSDGNESTLCGNGGRCLTAFAHDLGIIGKRAHFIAADGEHEALILKKEGQITHVRLKMNDVTVNERGEESWFINTGSPHYVMFTEGVEQYGIIEKAREIRYGSRFAQEGTNVDFVEIMEDHLLVRTYERGVEDETLSCGTGVTAAAIAFASRQGINPGDIRIKTRGGELKVGFSRAGNRFTDIWLEGPAEFVFQGEVEVKTED